MSDAFMKLRRARSLRPRRAEREARRFGSSLFFKHLPVNITELQLPRTMAPSPIATGVTADFTYGLYASVVRRRRMRSERRIVTMLVSVWTFEDRVSKASRAVMVEGERIEKVRV